MRAFARDERGNFAILTGFLAILLVGALGGIVDLSMQWVQQSVVQRAVDAASLAGAKALEFGTEDDARKAIQAAGKVNLPTDFPAVAFVGKIDEKAGTVEVTGTGALKPSFLPLLKINDLPLEANSTALIQRKSYIDFYFMLDVSESMNIAASDEDRDKLEAITAQVSNDGSNGNVEPRPCAFACHEAEPRWSKISVWEMNQRAEKKQKGAGARLRIDVLRDAAFGMIDEVLKQNSKSGSLTSTRVATNAFSSNFVVGVPPSTNADLLKASITGFGNYNKQPQIFNDHTDMVGAFGQFTGQLGAQGTGTEPLSPRKIAIVVTDGVRDDDPGFRRSGLGPLDPNLCRGIKKAGIDLAVLEIKYVANWDRDGFFRERVSRYYDAISPGLKGCASPGLHYVAEDADAAKAKLIQMVNDLMTVRRRLAG